MIERLSTHLLIQSACCGGAVLLALDHPTRLLKVGRKLILQPEIELEREGFVSAVVFPTGAIETDDRLLMHYGASDRYIQPLWKYNGQPC